MPYIRKYAGPLQPGRRSAYVKGGRRNVMRRRNAARKIQGAFRKRRYKPSAAFTKQMNKYNNINCEKKIMSMNNYLNGPGSAGYLQDLPCVGLNNAGLTNDALTCVVLQTGRQLTQLNAAINTSVGGTVATAMDGFSVLSGSGINQLIGAYAKITSTYLNLNITMDPSTYGDGEQQNALDACLPHQFRIIQVKARRDKMVSPGAQIASYGVPSLSTNLFRDELGRAKGLLSDCATQDQFTWFVNKQFWTILKDERFTLTQPNNNLSNLSGVSPNVANHKSARFKKYWLPKPKTKVRFEGNSVDGLIKEEPVDFNYVVHTVILCKNSSSGERASNHWSVQANGATAFIDE